MCVLPKVSHKNPTVQNGFLMVKRNFVYLIQDSNNQVKISQTTVLQTTEYLRGNFFCPLIC